MFHLVLGTVLLIGGVALKGLINLTLPEMVLFLGPPILLIYKLLNNHPSFLVHGLWLFGLCGSLAGLNSEIFVPTIYYYQHWGLMGVALGIVTGVLIPIQIVLFPIIAILKGKAIVAVCHFFAKFLFLGSGLVFYRAFLTPPLWTSLKENLTGRTSA